MKEFIISKNDAGQRLDKFVSKITTNLSGALLYKYLRKKAIKVNGKKHEISYRLQENDIVTLYINDEFFADDTPLFLKLNDKYDLDIIYEDENIILINKKPGILVHEDSNEQLHTLINYILAYLYSKKEYNPENENSFVPALCNRIDKNTGGIVIAAKNAIASREMYDIIKNREIKKYYLALVHGKMPKNKDILTAYHKKDSNKNQVYIYNTPAPDRKTIKTGYRVIKTGKNLSLLEVELFTGRTHQIRAHLSHIGHPLVGDTKYGTNAQNQQLPYRFQALYAYKLQFAIQDEDSPLSYLNQHCFEIENVYFKNDI